MTQVNIWTPLWVLPPAVLSRGGLAPREPVWVFRWGSWEPGSARQTPAKDARPWTQPRPEA